MVVCCSSRDELDAVYSAVSNLPYISFSSLYSDLVEAREHEFWRIFGKPQCLPSSSCFWRISHIYSISHKLCVTNEEGNIYEAYCKLFGSSRNAINVSEIL
ncbi:hypothetical protein QYF36_019094 [Acer negundo]|nr:hypothetical protein QYF36_019094 [Acer negundo]